MKLRLLTIFFWVVLFSSVTVSFSYATVSYAEKTGKDCLYCHKNPDGGGELNENGIVYNASLKNDFSFKRVLRFVVYYFHLFFAIMWFGTILYVHIILKPGYAAKGLPRGELMLGWLSIVIMFLTGITLTYLRFNTFSEIFSSRFGIILTIKVAVFAVMVLSAFFVTVFLGPKMKQKVKSKKDEGSLEFYDGKEGRRAYVSYNGKVFDVTDSKLWKNGVHMMRHNAGSDLTEALKQAPHGLDVLSRFPEVQMNIDRKSRKEGVINLFYVIAYTNLAFVFIIIFLITLWKW
ncbi:MAG: hypothetical protein OHK0040_09570 [bacterium]